MGCQGHRECLMAAQVLMLCLGLQREHRPSRCQCAVCLWRACRADKRQAAALRGRAQQITAPHDLQDGQARRGVSPHLLNMLAYVLIQGTVTRLFALASCMTCGRIEARCFPKAEKSAKNGYLPWQHVWLKGSGQVLGRYTVTAEAYAREIVAEIVRRMGVKLARPVLCAGDCGGG